MFETLDGTKTALVAVTILLVSGCGGGGGGGTKPAGAEPANYTVSSTTADSHGGITPATATVADGETATFQVTPDTGYAIDSVDGCEGTLSGSTYTTGTVTANCTVTATFAALSYTVSANAGSNGSITPGSATVTHGGTTAFTVTPDPGYDIDSVSGCGGSLSGSTYTTGPVAGDCTVTAQFDPLPSVSVGAASVNEGDNGVSDLTFTVTLSAQADGDVDVDYATSEGSAWEGGDYTGNTGTLTIPAATTSATLTVSVNGDITPEADETLTLTLSNISANATGTVVNDDPWGQINDTGITACGDYAFGNSTNHNNDVDCSASGTTQTVAGNDGDGDPVPAGQDALFGRDISANDASDGHAGFSFTKLDEGGRPLDDQTVAYGTTPWNCVLDRVTGLAWEVKTDDGNLQDKDWTYSWYNPDATTNGGTAGTENNGACVDAANCDTEKYIAAVNTAALCGYDDWRLPSAGELLSLVANDRVSPGIDSDWFPNTLSDLYWSSDSDANNSVSAIYVHFDDGTSSNVGKANAYSVRLVRGGL